MKLSVIEQDWLYNILAWLNTWEIPEEWFHCEGIPKQEKEYFLNAIKELTEKLKKESMKYHAN